MSATATYTLADRFAWFIDGLCKAIGVHAQPRGMDAALALATWNRVRVLGERLIALVVRARAGRLTGRKRTDTSRDHNPNDDTPHPNPPPQGGRERLSTGTMPLPREFGWVRRALPETAQFAGVLSFLLRDPAVVALVEATPEAGRILRPLCHLLGVQAPVFLRRWNDAGGAVAHTEPETSRATPEGVTPIPALPRCAGEGAKGADGSMQAPEPTSGAPATGGAETTAAVEETPPPPPPPADAAAAAAKRYAARPGGIYWNGSRWQWS